MLCRLISCYAMPCDASACHFLPCYAMPHYAVQRHAVQCHAMQRHVMLCYATLCRATVTVLCHAVLGCATPCCAMPCHAMPCRAVLPSLCMLCLVSSTCVAGLATQRGSQEKGLRPSFQAAGPSKASCAVASGWCRAKSTTVEAPMLLPTITAGRMTCTACVTHHAVSVLWICSASQVLCAELLQHCRAYHLLQLAVGVILKCHSCR